MYLEIAFQSVDYGTQPTMIKMDEYKQLESSHAKIKELTQLCHSQHKQIESLKHKIELQKQTISKNESAIKQRDFEIHKIKGRLLYVPEGEVSLHYRKQTKIKLFCLMFY